MAAATTLPHSSTNLVAAFFSSLFLANDEHCPLLSLSTDLFGFCRVIIALNIENHHIMFCY